MTATVIPLRRPSAGPCNSGTDPERVTPSCGRTDTRPYAAGPRCESHQPRTPKVTP